MQGKSNCNFFQTLFANVMLGIRNKATSKLNSVYDEILPTIEVHGPDNHNSVPTSVAKKWITASCLKYNADFDLYFTRIKNVMCSRPETDVTAGPQTTNAEEGAVPQTTTTEGGAERSIWQMFKKFG